MDEMWRRRVCSVLVAAAFVLWGGEASAADVVSGEVVDMSCYMPHPETGRGRGHRKCAETCLKKGLPMGVLAEDGQLYLALEDHDQPKAYAELATKAAETVTVEGEKVTIGGVQGIVVEAVR